MFSVMLLVIYIFANRGKVTKEDIAKRKSPALCKQTKQSKGGKAINARSSNHILSPYFDKTFCS